MSPLNPNPRRVPTPRVLRTGFLKSIGTERTTIVFLAGLVALLYLFTCFIGAEAPPESASTIGAESAAAGRDSTSNADSPPNEEEIIFPGP